MRELFFNGISWKALQDFCEKGYPKEVCGLLLGFIQGECARVEKVEVLENVLDGKHEKRLKELLLAGTVTLPETRALQGGGAEFFIDPNEHFSKVAKAEREGLDQIGIFHSHPDHPAKPSVTDQSQPMVAGWSSVIVAVEGGKFKEARSWFRENEGSSFQEEKIIVK